jgi:hypothetical protein
VVRCGHRRLDSERRAARAFVRTTVLRSSFLQDSDEPARVRDRASISHAFAKTKARKDGAAGGIAAMKWNSYERSRFARGIARLGNDRGQLLVGFSLFRRPFILMQRRKEMPPRFQAFG